MVEPGDGWKCLYFTHTFNVGSLILYVAELNICMCLTIFCAIRKIFYATFPSFRLDLLLEIWSRWKIYMITRPWPYFSSLDLSYYFQPFWRESEYISRVFRAFPLMSVEDMIGLSPIVQSMEREGWFLRSGWYEVQKPAVHSVIPPTWLPQIHTWLIFVTTYTAEIVKIYIHASWSNTWCYYVYINSIQIWKCSL